MKTRLLFYALLLVAGILNAQDTIRTLVISEVRLDDARESYVEISNVGNTTLNLSNFQIGVATPWNTPKEVGNLIKGWNVNANSSYRLPNKNLAPGKCFVIGGCYDWNPYAFARGISNTNRVMNKKEFWTISDIQAHFAEAPVQPAPHDSVNIWSNLLGTWGGRECIFLAQYLTPTDSVVIDQVNGFEFDTDGTRSEGPIDVAGVTNATGTCTLVRKFSVKSGNLDFLSARGLDYEDSEWMPIPFQLGSWEQVRSLFFTAGNHGDYNLDATTLSSSTVSINWTDSILTVPWGVRRDDSLMFQFDHNPGLAWHFNYAKTYEDSAFYSLRTGDMMTIYVCGNDLDVMNFKIVVSPATASENRVVPKKMADRFGHYSIFPPGWVITDKIPGMDTIMEIPFGIRLDTLLKYLEKAPKANWEIEWVDGNVRTDLQTGDILKVTSESGAVKKYYIKPDKIVKSHNPALASITWPDIPEFYKGLFGWVGDTIPGFTSSKYDFKVQVPYDVDGIPALVGKTQDVNARLEVKRAVNLTGSVENRTVTFKTTAVDDTSKLNYRVLLEKEKDFSNVQPWLADPFVSQLVCKDQWANYFLEIVNPGTEALDMSNYMIEFSWTKVPLEGITWYNGTNDWPNRYFKYIPGYKWQSEAEWAIQPRILESDISNVNPIVQPGDVFVLGWISPAEGAVSRSGYPWWASLQCDIDLGRGNPWGETIAEGTAAGAYFNNGMFMYKILNDSIKNGTKAATDPLDFELIESFAAPTGNDWIIGGVPAGQENGFIRKPEYYKGNTAVGGSFGTDLDNSEWQAFTPSYWTAQGIGWPDNELYVAQGLGSHFMNDVTVYRSTVSSSIYKVSEGFSMDEEIRGIITGTTVNDFLANLVKADPGQTLTVNGSSGALLPTDLITDGNTLEVVSADAQNTSGYVLAVSPDGFSSDAVLVSTVYTINVSGATGTITGFNYDVSLGEAVGNVTVPPGASFTVIDGNNAYVPYMFLNYDTMMVDVQVSADIYFEVVAENGTTKIVYHLVPNLMNRGAFVTSNIFKVDEPNSLISLIPEGTAVYGLLKYLVPAPGATVKILDKLGYERTIGNVIKDDKVAVTSEDGLTTRIYFLNILGQPSNYLAYVVSNVYWVNQADLIIAGSNIVSTTVSGFLNNLIASENATMLVTNAAGVEKTGNMAIGDKLIVTAGNSMAQVTYVIDDNTAVEKLNSKSISVYPNPSTGLIYVSGLDAGNRVFVTNMLGQRVIDKVVHQNTETINLSGHSAGLYFVTVNDADKIVGRYKLILQ